MASFLDLIILEYFYPYHCNTEKESKASNYIEQTEEPSHSIVPTTKVMEVENERIESTVFYISSN